MGQLVGGGELDRDSAFAGLYRAGVAIGLPASEVERALNGGLDKGEQHPRRRCESSPQLVTATEARLVAIDLLDRVQRSTWPGRSGARNKKLLVAILGCSIEIGKVEFDLSIREWAERAGLSKSVVQASYASLAPWVVPIRPGSRATGRQTRWKLGVAPRNENSDTRAESRDLASAMSGITRLHARGRALQPDDDFFHGRPGLWAVYQLLDPDFGDFTVKDVCAEVGLTAETVRRYLGLLAELEIFERVDRATWRALDERSLNAEVLASTFPFGEERRQRHKAERAAYEESAVNLSTGELTRRVKWSKAPISRAPRRGTSKQTSASTPTPTPTSVSTSASASTPTPTSITERMRPRAEQPGILLEQSA